MRGEDPDDPEVFMKDVVSELELALSMVQEEAERQGIDVDAQPPVKQVVSLSYRKLCLTALELMNETMAVRIAEGEAKEEMITELPGKVLLVNGKIARLNLHAQNLAEGRDSSDIEFDIVPNLMLIELLLEDVSELVGQVEETECDRVPASWLAVFRALSSEFVPWAAQTPPAARKTMDQLIAADLAPSPFCVSESSGT
jgi:hypothetical protein